MIVPHHRVIERIKQSHAGTTPGAECTHGRGLFFFIIIIICILRGKEDEECHIVDVR